MKKWGIKLLVWTLLALTGTASAICLPLNPAASETDIAGLLSGHGCFVGYTDAQVDWSLTLDDIGSRNTLVQFDATDGGSLSLLSSNGDELAEIEAGETANWLLHAGDFRIRVDNPSGDRFVVTTSRGIERVTFESSVRGTDNRQSIKGAISSYAGLLQDGPYYVTWGIREEDPENWDLQLTPGPGLPLNVKIFDPDGNMLEHIQTDPGVPAQRMPLQLAPGNYTFVIAQADWSGATVRINAAPVGVEAVDGRKTGRSYDQATANRITLSGVSGTLEEDNRDAFRLDVTADDAGLYNLSVNNENDMTLCMIGADYQDRNCWQGVGITVSNVRLDAGTHYFSIWGDRRNPDSYELEFEPVAGHNPLDVTAPAGRRQEAYLMVDDAARLTLGARTETWLAFQVDDPGLYRVQMQGADPVHLEMYDGGGTQLRTVDPDPDTPTRIDNVPLREGLNYLMLDARAGQYAIRVLRVGDLPVPDEVLPEAEADGEVDARPEGAIVPSLNASSGTASPLRPGVPYAATLLPDSQYAYYRFTLHNEQMVRVTLTPPEDTPMRLYLPGYTFDSTSFEGPTVYEDWLAAGTYEVSTRSLEPADGWYTLQLDLLDPFERDTPYIVHTQNDGVPLPADFHVNFENERQDDTYYRLPELDQPTVLTVRLNEGDYRSITIYDHDGDAVDSNHVEDSVATYELQGGNHDLRLRAGYAWDVELEFADGPEPQNSSLADDVELDLQLDADEVAAWSAWGQQLNGTLTIRNTGDTDYVTDLLTHSTDPRVQFRLSEEHLELAAGETTEVPVELILPADVHAGSTLDFNVALQDETGATNSTRASVLPICEAPLVGGHSWWPLPESVLGHLNVAWQPFGAVLQNDSNSDLAIFDGRVSPAQPPTRGGVYEYPLDLGETRELVATALHPTGNGAPSERLKRFEIAVSDDGNNWETVLSDSLSSAPVEQVFMFEEPLATRWVKLVMLESFSGGNNRGIGEWKLLSAPDGVQRNIAAAALGGHIVRSVPVFNQSDYMLQDADYGNGPSRENVRVTNAGPLPEWVIGFHHNRVASIGSLEWLDSSEEQNIDRLKVSVSLESPLGPWEELADWQLERQDGRAVLQLDEPTWARFVRFEVQGELPERSINYQLPLQLKVFESGAVPSILGEWGIDNSRSYYEYANPELFTEATVTFGSNGSMETAQLLEDHETGYVQTGVAEGWYRVVMPAERNLAIVQVASEPGVVLGYELFDADGALLQTGLSDGGQVRVNGDSGTEWFLRVFEPPRSVLFAWDTSGSVRPYQSQTYAALEGFAGAIRGDLEAVMLLAYGQPPAFLMPEWSSSAAEVSRTINQYDRYDDSSDSELNLLAASDAIADRDGVRAIVLITDAESGGHGKSAELWDSLADSGAQVYALEISSAGGAASQDLMQDWAAANGGHYVNATDLLQLEQGFARADCLIRRAKYVEVSVEFQEREAQPGSLAVLGPIAADDETTSTVAADGGILVILDASGSMYRTLDGRYRYEIAKDVLSDLVTNVLPTDSPFALRVFGNREANTCRSDLEVPLAPLDAAAVNSVIGGIVPQSFAGTPIAASLQAATSDLAAAEGARSVVLITDGEESCDGDVEAAINDLRNAGYDVTLNVIGFDFDADDQEAAREQFRQWAELGGGQYFDAVTADELEGALRSSVGRPYEVYDAVGELVARGVVDGPAVELEGGEYRVVVSGEPPVEFEAVRVDGGGVELRME